MNFCQWSRLFGIRILHFEIIKSLRRIVLTKAEACREHSALLVDISFGQGYDRLPLRCGFTE